MGIRFACHVCGKHLNIKADLAGKRGICPACSSRFRIPKQDAERSTPIEEPAQVGGVLVNPQHAAQPTTSSPAVTTSQTQSDAHTTTTSNSPSGVTSLDILVSDPNATWYVRPPTGGQYGPASGEILKQWIAEGRVASTALLWRDGWPQWREASEALPELVQGLPSTSAPANAGAVASPASATVASKSLAAKDQAQVTLGNAQLPASPSAHVSATEHTRVAENRNPSPVVQPSSAPVTSDNFGYEDSDFANGKSYSTPTVDSSSFVGRNNVGKERRQRASRRTLSIVVLGLVAVLLLLALAFVMTQQS